MKKQELTPVDIYENNDELLLLFDVPGVTQDAATVRLDQGKLQVEDRSFELPTTVDPNGISAKLAGGVLEVRLKKAEQYKPKRIEVRSN